MAQQKAETEETFQIDPDFLECYTILLNKYVRSGSNFTILDLARDIQKALRCDTVAILRPGPSPSLPSSILCCPPSSRGKVSLLLGNKKVTEALKELTDVEECVRSLEIDCSTIMLEKTGLAYLDLIRLDGLSASDEQGESSRVFMLFDAWELARQSDQRAERRFQCGVLTQFLYSCWAELSRPVCRSKSSDGQAAGRPIPVDRLRTATLAELIDEATRSARKINTYNDGGIGAYFECETQDAIGRFDWGIWVPRWTTSDAQDDLRKQQDQGRSLVYWCRWNESHHRLENELAWPDVTSRTEGRPPGRQNPEPSEWEHSAHGPSRSPEQESEDQAHPIVKVEAHPIATWVRNQRTKADTIVHQLGELQGMASAAFLTQGRFPFCAPTTQGRLRCLSRNSLLVFGLSRWLAPEGQFRQQLTDPACSDVDFCRMLHAIAVVGQFLLSGEHQERFFIHRLIQLVACYSHTALGIPDRIDLRAHLLQAARGEPALHALKPFYRDHFYHVLQVCLLGHLLLETEIGPGQCLWQLVASLLRLPADEKRVLRLWYLAALLHDIGYAMDVLDGSRRLLGFFRHSAALRQMDKSFSEAVAALRKSKEFPDLGIEVSEQESENKDEVERDHGIVSAMHLNSLLAHIASDDESLDRSQYAPAVRAIAYHNLRRNSDRISFAKEPLAFLLALCDELQEWRRPRLAYSTSPEWMLARLTDDAEDGTAIEGAFQALEIGLDVSPGVDGKPVFRVPPAVGGNPPKLHFTLKYDKRINRNSGVFELWLNATQNFQRLDCDGLPLDITVAYVTPFYVSHEQGDLPQAQLHRLRDAAYDTHMAFLANWFPTDKDSGLSGVSWAEDVDEITKGQIERLELDVRKLSRRALMTQSMEVFRKRLQQWKRYLDDRDFPGDYAAGTPE